VFTKGGSTALGCLPFLAQLHEAEIDCFYYCHSVRLRTRVMRNPMNRDERTDRPDA
jgi:hypothetical protein